MSNNAKTAPYLLLADYQ